MWTTTFRGTVLAMTERRRVLTPREDNARLVLRTLCGVLNVSDRELAERITAQGRTISRAAIQQRRNGDKPLDLRDIDECAQALGVPSSLFDQEPIDAARWVLDNASELVILGFGWLRSTSAAA